MNDNRSAMRKTIVARIATFDTSIKPTEEQVAETRRLLALVMDAIGPKHQDFGLIKRIDDTLAAGGQNTSAPEVPVADVTAREQSGQNSPPHGEMLPSGNSTQDAMSGGNVADTLGVTTEAVTRGLRESMSPMGPRVDKADADMMGYTLASLRVNEGFKPKAYWDSIGGKWTLGHGLTVHPDGRPVRRGDTIDESASLQAVEKYIRSKLIPMAEKNVAGWKTMDPRLRAAMLDTAYNAGPGYFGSKSPKMLRRLASGEDPAKVLAEENATWNKSGGVVVKGLENRRQRVKEKLIDWYSRDNSKSV